MSDELELEVYEGVGKVQKVPLPDGASLLVGRVKTCDVVLIGNGVSRQHCRFTRTGDKVELENLSTTKGGTQVAGRKLDEKATARVRIGDEVTVGETVIVLRVAGVAATKEKKAERAPEKGKSDRRVRESDRKARARAEDDEDEEPEASQASEASEASDASKASQASETSEPSEESEPPKAERKVAAAAAVASGDSSASEPAPTDTSSAPAASETGSTEAAVSDEAPVEDEAELKRKNVEAFVRKKQLERTIRLVTSLVLVAMFSAGAAWFILRVILEQPATNVATPGSGGGSGATEVGPPVDDTETEGEDDDPAAPVTGGNPDRAWTVLLALPPGQVAGGLEAFADRFPADSRAEDARVFAEKLRLVSRTGGGSGGAAAQKKLEAGGEALRREAARLREAGQLSRAAALLELAGTVTPGTAAARAAGGELSSLRETAATTTEELGKQARDLAQRLGPVQAILLVLEERSKLRGLGQDETLDALVADLEERAAQALQARRGPEIELSARATTVEKEGLDAALRFDFETAWSRLDELLTLSITDEGRLRAHWQRHQVRALEEVYQAMLTAAQGAPEQRPTLTVRGTLKARLKASDGKEVILEPIVGRGEGELKWPWTRVTPYQVQELMALLGAGDAKVTLAKAYHAFSTGLEDVGMEQLVLLAQSKKKLQGEVFSFYSLVSGVPMPEGGFVVFEGRLVDPVQRERVLAEREAARQAAIALAQEAKEQTEERRLATLLGKVLALMDQGYYENGRAALQKIAEKHASVPGVGDVAARRLASPILRRRDLRAVKNLGTNGPSANRFDIYFMGDGFVLNDQKQVQFDRYADQAMKFCQLQDFFKEYDQYINYWACNTMSKDEGLTKDGEAKDTALHGKIDGGVYTIQDRANAFALCENLFPGEHDRLVVGIGNDFANVATGGGGVVACAKTMLSAVPHEIGHAFGGLGDEYDQDPTGKPASPSASGQVPARVLDLNLVAGNRRDEMLEIIPWKDWLDPVGTAPFNWTGKPIDLFEGGNRQPKDVWRPQRACVMRDIGSPFCAPCMERMVLNLYDLVRPIDQVWPDQAELTMGKEPVLLRVLVMKPKTHDLFVHWRRKSMPNARPQTGEEEEEEPTTGTREREGAGAKLGPDGKPEVKDISGRLTTDGFHFIHYIKIGPKDLEPGRYELSAEVWDPTPWVLEKNRGKLRQTRTWILTVPQRPSR